MAMVIFLVASYVVWGLYNMLYNNKKLFHPIDFMCGMVLFCVGYVLGSFFH